MYIQWRWSLWAIGIQGLRCPFKYQTEGRGGGGSSPTAYYFFSCIKVPISLYVYIVYHKWYSIKWSILNSTEIYYDVEEHKYSKTLTKRYVEYNETEVMNLEQKCKWACGHLLAQCATCVCWCLYGTNCGGFAEAQEFVAASVYICKSDGHLTIPNLFFGY